MLLRPTEARRPIYYIDGWFDTGRSSMETGVSEGVCDRDVANTPVLKYYRQRYLAHLAGFFGRPDKGNKLCYLLR